MADRTRWRSLGRGWTISLQAKAFLVSGVAVLCMAQPLSAGGGRESEAERDPFRFVRITQDQGLSQSLVLDFARDDRGFLWIATSHGLNRFDGLGTEVYFAEKDNPSALSSSNIRALDFGQSGHLWVATVAGLNRYDPSLDTFTRYHHDPIDPSSLSDDALSTVVETRGGSVWVGTTQSGLNLLDPKTGRAERFRHDSQDSESLDADQVLAVVEDTRSRIWVGTESGLNLFQPEDRTFRRFHRDSSLAGRTGQAAVTAIYEDAYGRLWIGRRDGVEIFNVEIGTFTPFDVRLPGGGSPIITGIQEDSQRILWIGTLNHGMASFNQVTGQIRWHQNDPDVPFSLSSNAVRSLFLDGTGGLWVGCHGAGVSMYHPSNFRFTPTRLPRAMIVDHVRGFTEDLDGTVWVATQGGGLAGLDRESGTWRVFEHQGGNDTGIPSNDVYALHGDRIGAVWVGTEGGWLSRFDPSTGDFHTVQTQPDGTAGVGPKAVRAILAGVERDLWVGTDGGGLLRFRHQVGIIERYRHDPRDPNSISGDRVRALTQAPDGTLWVGTYGGGVSRLDPESGVFTRFQHQYGDTTSLGDDQVMAIMLDPKGDLWVGTNGGGLNHMRRGTGKFERFTSKNGLLNDAIYGVLVDDNGLVWFSHDRGLSRLDPDTRELVNFDKTDGLQSNEFNGGASYLSQTGEMFFGGLEGYNAFLPSEIHPTGGIPRVAFTDFQLFNQSVTLGPDESGRTVLDRDIGYSSTITLTHKDEVFSIGFAAMDFVHPERTQYAYRMDGFDDEWNYVGNRRFATYTNLPPGTYTFEVKASNSDGDWGEASANLRVIVEPPFWSRLWFRAGLLILVLGSIVAVIRVKTDAIARQNRRLEEKVALRTAELLENAEELEEARDRAEEALVELQEAKDQLVDVAHKAGMAQTAVDVLHNVGNILNSLATSASMIHSKLDGMRVEGFVQANELLGELVGSGAVGGNGKGPKLHEYYQQLQSQMASSRSDLLDNSTRLAGKISAITDVISDQQRIAKSRGITEVLALEPIVEDALDFQAGSIARHHIEVQRDFQPVPPVLIERAKVLHVVLNLVKNAKEAMLEPGNKASVLRVGIRQDGDFAVVSVQDSGKGMDEETLEKAFGHGFTTRADGHGFGLHSCANYMSEMGGSIRAESNGPGKGSTFSLSFPLDRTGSAMVEALMERTEAAADGDGTPAAWTEQAKSDQTTWVAT